MAPNTTLTDWIGTNLALGRPVEQSSIGPWDLTTDSTELAGDAKNDGNEWFMPVKYDTNPWWQVDVGSAQIQRIDILNLKDCCQEQLNDVFAERLSDYFVERSGDYFVFVSNQPFSPTDTPSSILSQGVWNEYVKVWPGTPVSIPVNQPGRYVRVQSADANYLDIAEVQVWGTAQPSSSPLAYWKFDEAGATQAADSSGNDNTGSLQNGSAWTSGRSGNALSFDGTNDSVVIAGQPLLASVANNFAIAFWAYPLSPHEIDAEGTDNWGGVANQRYAIGPQHGAGAYGNADHAGAGVSVGTNGVSVYEHSANYMPATLVYPTAIKGWTHIVVVYEDRQPRLYINGVLARTGVKSAKPYVHIFPDQIGGMAYGYFNGKLDDVRIYNRVLSPTEIGSLYSSSGPALPEKPTGLTASAIDATQVKLTWRDNSSNESGFKVERYDSTNPSWIEIGSVSPNATAFVDTGNLGSANFLYRVRATSVDGDSPYSNVATTVQDPCPPPDFPRVTNASTNSLTVQWEPPQGIQPANYLLRIQLLIDPQDWRDLPRVSGNETQTLIDRLEPNTGYRIEIKSQCSANVSSQEWASTLGLTDAEECNAPRNVQAIGFSDRATITWRKVDGARAYNIRVVDSSGNEIRFANVRGDNKDVLGLSPSMDYQVFVSSVCSMDGNVHSVEVSTPLHTADAGPPPTDCMKPGSFAVVDVSAVGGTAKWDEVLATEKYPRIDYFLQYKDVADPEGLIQRQIRGATSWFIEDLKPSTVYDARIRTLCAYPGGAYAYSDYVELPQFTTLSCETPTDISSKNITYNSAKISWKLLDFAGYSWLVRYRNTGAGQSHEWLEQVTNEKDNTTMLGGQSNPLVPDSPYDYEVITRCGNAYRSVPSSILRFPTKPCPIPENLEAKNKTVTGAKLTWEPAGDGNDVRYRKYCKDCPDNVAPWQEIRSIIGGSQKISDLSSGTRYEFQVRSLCAHVTPTAWSRSADFWTLDCASAVPDVSVTNIDKHSALIQWPEVRGATYYQYRIKQTGGSYSNPFDLLINFQTLGGLEKCTDYVVQVRSLCTPPGDPNPKFSDWTTKTFTTDGCVCENPMILHGDHCANWFKFVNLSDGLVNVPQEIRWATQKIQANQWRFRWRECTDFTNCSGPFSIIDNYTFKKEKFCFTNKHVDYFVYGVSETIDHYYQFQAQYRCDNGTWSDWVGDVYKYAFVQGLNVSNLTTTSATVSWDLLPEATGYVISYATQDTEPSGGTTVGAGTNTFTLTKLDPNTAYDVEVTAILPNGMSMPATKSISTVSGECRYAISPTSTSVEVNGGSGAVTISADAKCEWSATSDVPWLTITSGEKGSGNGTVEYSVDANTETDARTGTLTVAGNAVEISQSGTGQTNPVPSISSISPASAIAGSGPLTLTVNGAGFASNSVVQVNGSSRSTTVQNSSLLTATLPSSDLANPFTLAITVSNPAPGGGLSNPVNFTVTSPTGCTRRSPTVTMSPADQRGYRGQHLSYQVTITNNDSAQCAVNSFDVAPTFPAVGWGQSPISMTFVIMPGESASRDAVIWSAPSAPYASHIIHETATSASGQSGSGQATYTVYSIAPPDTCGRANPTVTISPSDQRGYGGQHLTYRVFVTNNDNPQCGPSGFDVTPAFPGPGWGQAPTGMGFTISPGETVWRDAVIWSPAGAAFTAHVFTETATSGSETSGSGQATYTVYDPMPPDTCGRANPTVTITPANQNGTQAQRLSYWVTVTNNDAPACGGSSFVVRPTLPTVPSGYPWTHVPEDYFTIFASSGESASREINVISASLAQMGENTIVWTANHTRYDFGSGHAIFNVIPYGASVWKFFSPRDVTTDRYQIPWCRTIQQPWELEWLLIGSCRQTGQESRGRTTS